MWLLDIFKIKKFKQQIKDLENRTISLNEEVDSLKSIKYSMDQLNYKNISDEITKLHKEQEILDLNICEKNDTIITLESSIAKLKSELVDLEEEDLMQSFGFYKPKYDFENSTQYSNELNNIRAKQKTMVKNKKATIHPDSYTVDGDVKKGKEFISDTIKLTLKAFNNECDNIISKIKFNNIDRSEQRIYKIFEQINSLTDMEHVSITNKYLKLKLEEMYLKYEFEQKKQEEKEDQQKIKEQMREEAKALKEIEAAKRKIEKEETHFLNAQADLQTRLEKATDKEKEDLMAKLKALEEKINEINNNKQDILNREQNTRAGYVYIISNIGSFGEDIYKIGMTRRLEPMDRISELSSASVPFTFDVHAMIFADDAPKLENELHKAFDSNRVNRINHRKEFFNVSLNDIKKVVEKNFDKTVEFTKLADASEFRQSQKLKQQSNKQAS